MEKTALDLLKEYRAIIDESNKDPFVDLANDSVKKQNDPYTKLATSSLKKKKVCADCGSCPPEKGGNGYCKRCAGMNESKVNESIEDSPVFYAIMRRLDLSYPDIFTKYGYDVVAETVLDEASFVGDVDEIGSSDVSIWTNHVIHELERNEPGDF